MKDLLFCIKITPMFVYLTFIQVIIGQAFYYMLSINKRYIIWFLLLISMLVTFTLSGFNLISFIESIMATSLAGTIYQIYKNIERKIASFKGI